MLNTDLHDTRLMGSKRKMTKAEFVRNTSTVDSEQICALLLSEVVGENEALYQLERDFAQGLCV